MSFLAGRLAAKEGAYFLQESKNVVGRHAQNLPASALGARPESAPPSPDVLPEILRHSVPIKVTPPPSDPSLYASSRWTLQPGGAEAAGVSPDVLNPFRSYISLSQATFGPKRCCLTVKGLTEKFKEKDTAYSGSATFTYEAFMLTVLPFIIA